MKQRRVLKPSFGLNHSFLRCFGSWFAVGLWAAAIFWLSSLSAAEISRLDPFNVWDKAAHFLAFALGGTLLTYALLVTLHRPLRRLALLAAALISLFGASDEWHQTHTPHRRGADVSDWSADTLGAIFGAGLASWFYVRYHRKDPPAPARD